VHYGQTDAVHAARQDTLDRAFRENPQRFVNKPSRGRMTSNPSVAPT
jgi:putative transposase